VRAEIISSYLPSDNSTSRCAITCFGRNTDRFLFDRAHGEAYHPFILGQAEVGEDIKLNAGLAHGILPGTKLAIFYSNVRDNRNKKIEHVVVESADSTTSILRRSSAGRAAPLPSIFYATEIRYPADEVRKLVRIFFEGPSAGYPQPLTICGADKVNQADDANLTLKFRVGRETPIFRWNGAKGDPKPLRGDYRVYSAESRSVKMLKKATRFSYHLFRVSPVDSPLEKNLDVQLLNIQGSKTTDKDTSKGNLFKDFCAELKQRTDETLGPFFLDIHNKSKHDLWLYVLVFEPTIFGISKSRSSICDVEC